MVRSPVAIPRISVLRHNSVNAHSNSSLNHSLEVVHLKPQQYAMSIWQVVAVATRTVVVVYFEAVQLQNQLST